MADSIEKIQTYLDELKKGESKRIMRTDEPAARGTQEAPKL
jgi:hypothetical protein